jgi:hypothetical protein
MGDTQRFDYVPATEQDALFSGYRVACLGCWRVHVRICTMAKRAATLVGQGIARQYLQGRDAKPTQLQEHLAGLILLCVVYVDAAVYI